MDVLVLVLVVVPGIGDGSIGVGTSIVCGSRIGISIGMVIGHGRTDIGVGICIDVGTQDYVCCYWY